jgi:hypothetical protein
MTRNIRIINVRDFVSANPDGLLNLEESEQLLREVVRSFEEAMVRLSAGRAD